MIATVSPADDNYEETLSTLRYADRAKKITNHAVVNEDKNAKLIKELRAEVEMLRRMLTEKVGDDQDQDLLRKISENENFMKAMSLTWEEKLAKSGQNLEVRRQILERMGVHLDSSEQTNNFYISRLSSDPSMNEVLKYYLQDNITKVGTNAAAVEQDVKLTGLGIKPEHCLLIKKETKLFIEPKLDSKTCLNGKEITKLQQVCHGDRLLLGSNNFFRVHCPTPDDDQSLEPFDWTSAQAELVSDNQNMMVIDKFFSNFGMNNEDAVDQNNDNGQDIMQWLGEGSTNKDSKYKRSIEKLKAGWILASALVRDANVVASELQRSVKYSITLRIPPENLSPNNTTGVFVENPSILVKSVNDGAQIWTVEKLDTRLKDMIDLYEKISEEGQPFTEIGKSLPDPFFDTIENHVLIGVANIYLAPLFHDIKFEYNTPIISQDGKVSGKLMLELHRTSGHMDNEDADSNSEILSQSSTTTSNSEETRPSLKFRFSVKSVSGLPQSLAHFVFCQFTFNDQLVVIPSQPTQTSRNSGTTEFVFNFAKDYTVNVTDNFKTICKTSAISVQVFGQKSKGFFSIREALRDRRRAQTVADRYSIAHPDLCWVCFNLNLKCEHRNSRWSELVRKIQLWIEIQVTLDKFIRNYMKNVC